MSCLKRIKVRIMLEFFSILHFFSVFAAINSLYCSLLAPAAVIAPTKSVSKVKLSSNIPKGNFSISPATSPEKPGANIPSFPGGSDANNEVITPFNLNKGGASKTEKATSSKMSKGINRRESAHSTSVDDNTNEVRSLLISALSENPKGLSLKVISPSLHEVSRLTKLNVQL